MTSPQRRSNDPDEALTRQTADHLDVPADADADTKEIRGTRGKRERDGDAGPLAGLESAQAEQSDQADDPDERIVSSGQTEDHPARLEHDDPLERDVHRAPTPGAPGRSNSR